MASAAKRSGEADAPEQSTRRESGQDRSRLLPVLAVERVLRAVLLIGVGLICGPIRTRIGPMSREASWGG